MAADTYFDRVGEAAGALTERLGDVPAVAIVLGSGLGAFGDSLGDAVTLPYESIPHWPASRVIGHAGKLVAGRARGRRVLALSGRAHFYEGHDLRAVTFATRVLGRLGVKTLILTNAAGGINTRFGQGALMLMDDHINLLGTNPLIGPNDDRFGRRFPDMSEIYSKRLRGLATEAAAAIGLPIEHGVYIASRDRATRRLPRFCIPGDWRRCRGHVHGARGRLSARTGHRSARISCISNMAAGILPQPLTEEEVYRNHRPRARAIHRAAGGRH
jgi:purine-nucleoside phosphorylase